MEPYTDITIHDFSSSSKKKLYLLSYCGTYYEVSYSIVLLIIELQQCSTLREAVDNYVQKRGGRYTVEQVTKMINQFITPIFHTKKNAKTYILV